MQGIQVYPEKEKVMQAEEEVGKEIQKDQNSRNIEAQYTAEVNLNLTVVPVDFG